MFYSQRDGTFPETRRLTMKKKDDPRETRSSWGGLRYLKRHPCSDGNKNHFQRGWKPKFQNSIGGACAQESFTWQKRSTLLIQVKMCTHIAICNSFLNGRWRFLLPIWRFCGFSFIYFRPLTRRCKEPNSCEHTHKKELNPKPPKPQPPHRPKTKTP